MKASKFNYKCNANENSQRETTTSYNSSQCINKSFVCIGKRLINCVNMPPTATGMAQVSTKILNSPLNNSLPKVGYGRDNVGLRLTQQNKNTVNMVRRQPLPWYYQLPLEETTDFDSNWVSFWLEVS